MYFQIKVNKSEGCHNPLNSIRGRPGGIFAANCVIRERPSGSSYFGQLAYFVYISHLENILVWSLFILRYAHGKAGTKKRKSSLVENQEETRPEEKEREEKLPARKEKKPRGWQHSSLPRRHSWTNVGEECVTSQKNVCVGGYLSSSYAEIFNNNFLMYSLWEC